MVSDEENDDYFSSRPRGSQISASVSLQSQELDSYESLLEQSKNFEIDHLDKDITRPRKMGRIPCRTRIYRVWIDQKNRLHKKRVVYDKK